MTLFAPQSFTRFVLGLKATTMVEQWESHVAKVGGKVFGLCGADGGSIAFKVSETSFEVLTGLEGIGQAPYFAKRHWVSVDKGALGYADLKGYLAASHAMVASKLTRKARAELGLSEA